MILLPLQGFPFVATYSSLSWQCGGGDGFYTADVEASTDDDNGPLADIDLAPFSLAHTCLNRTCGLKVFSLRDCLSVHPCRICGM